jgi:hypothetical protein
LIDIRCCAVVERRLLFSIRVSRACHCIWQWVFRVRSLVPLSARVENASVSRLSLSTRVFCCPLCSCRAVTGSRISPISR